MRRRARSERVPRCLVLDLGNGSGRAMLAELCDGAIRLSELHRFGGYEVRLPDGPAWDIATLLAGVDAGLRAAAEAGGVDSIGVDSWGVDFALLDAQGGLVDQPRTHRHARGARGMAALSAACAGIAERSGVQVLPITTVFHLQDWALSHPAEVARVRHFLMIADLVSHHLSGVAACERTLARTSGLVALESGDWDPQTLQLTGLAATAFGRIVPAGTVLGPLRPELCTASGLDAVPVVTVAAHDTASAVLGLAPANDEAFVSCGSWNLIGIEVPDGLAPAWAAAEGFGLEGGVDGCATVIRSLQGMHLVRRLRDAWGNRTGKLPEFGAIVAAAAAASPETPAIDPSDPLFFGPPDMIAALKAHRPGLRDDDLGALARAVYRGLAEEIAAAVGTLESLSGRTVRRIRLGGGGAGDAMLCQMAADASGLPVAAGPTEASATGNALVQFAATGALPSIAAGRALCATSAALRLFEPSHPIPREKRSGPPRDDCADAVLL